MEAAVARLVVRLVDDPCCHERLQEVVIVYFFSGSLERFDIEPLEELGHGVDGLEDFPGLLVSSNPLAEFGLIQKPYHTHTHTYTTRTEAVRAGFCQAVAGERALYGSTARGLTGVIGIDHPEQFIHELVDAALSPRLLLGAA